MKAFWDSRFEEKTTAGTFFREDGSSCIMPMMKQQVFTERKSWPRQGGMYDEKDEKVGVRAASLFFPGGKEAPVFMDVLPAQEKKLKQFIAGTPPPGKGPEIKFNRPFLWLVYSPEDRAVVFAGTYAGPECLKKE